MISNTVILTPKTRINKRCKIHEKVSIVNSYIGFGTYVGSHSNLSNAKIGAFCSISNNVEIITATHPTKNFVSTHPAFYSTKRQIGFTFTNSQLFDEKIFYNKRYSIVIGNDVWIGAHSIIMGGVKIGDGSVIAAGSVVTKDVEPYHIVGGVPAKKIRKRFSDDQIQFLLKTCWWNKSFSWIEENAYLFNNIERFMKKVQIEEEKL